MSATSSSLSLAQHLIRTPFSNANPVTPTINPLTANPTKW